MKLYIAAGQYVGTQADARKLDKNFLPVDVPVDKENLIAYLNKHATGIPLALDPNPTHTYQVRTPLPAGARPVESAEAYVSPLTAATTIERIDGQMISEAIKRMTEPQAVAAVAGAVADRFKVLSQLLTPPAVEDLMS